MVSFTVRLARQFSTRGRSFPPWLQDLFEIQDLEEGTNAMVQDQRTYSSLEEMPEHCSRCMMS